MAAIYNRESLEFGRVAFFCDAVYAISLTLLITSLDVPEIVHRTDASDLWSALGDVQGRIITFFVSFIVIASFWLAHHHFVSRLGTINRSLMMATMAYLAFVAFLPFPSAVLGAYNDNPVGVSFYAVSLAFVSGMEGVLLWVAWRGALLIREMSPAAFRWSMVATLVPVAMFLISIPIAFASPTLGIVTWFVTFPVETLVDRFRPADVVD